MDALDNIFNSADMQEPEIEIKTNDFYRFKLLIYIDEDFNKGVNLYTFKRLGIICQHFLKTYTMNIQNGFDYLNYRPENFKMAQITIWFDMRPLSSKNMLNLLQNISLLVQSSKYVPDGLAKIVTHLICPKTRPRLCCMILKRFNRTREFRLDPYISSLAYLKVEHNFFDELNITPSAFVQRTNELLRYVQDRKSNFRILINDWMLKYKQTY
jgi:hypothetical protein